VDGIAPSGWHVPTNTEWGTLVTYLGGASVAGGKLKDTKLWLTPNTGATNETGFTARPGGGRGSNGIYGSVGVYGFYWSTTEDEADAYIWYMDRNSASVVNGGTNKKGGYSVRLIKDTSVHTEGETLTDPDGNVYETVKIGDQVWTVENYTSTKYANGTSITSVTDNTAWSELEAGAYCNYDNDAVNSISIYKSGRKITNIPRYYSITAIDI
jgi:hypothetical protein